MQRDPTTFTGNPSFAYGHEADRCEVNEPFGGQCNYKVPVSHALGVPSGMTSPQIRSPLGVFEFQPSKVCPRNFIIFDHNDDKGRVVYNPSLANKLNLANTDMHPCHGEVLCRSSCQDIGNLEEYSASFKEDTEEIDALLSSDEESDEDDDVVSTGRSPDPFESDLFDSSSLPSFKQMRHFSGKNSVSYGSMENITHEKMRKMITVLRGIVPGGHQLDTPAVLDEAVRYLKFLKVETKKLDVEGSEK